MKTNQEYVEEFRTLTKNANIPKGCPILDENWLRTTLEAKDKDVRKSVEEAVKEERKKILNKEEQKRSPILAIATILNSIAILITLMGILSLS